MCGRSLTLLTAVTFLVCFQGYLTSCAEQIACLHDPRNSLRLKCPRGQVILRPKVKVGKMAAKADHASGCEPNAKIDCFGTTPEVITLANNCHFQQKCTIKLNRFMPITSADDRSCLAARPDYAILYSYECVCRKTLHFVCLGSGDQSLRRREGVLASHSSYPWHYPTHQSPCVAFFPKRLDHRLALWTEDIDLDPDGRDRVSVHLVNVDGEQKITGDPLVYSQHGFNLTLPSSKVEIRFVIGEYSKSGRGFVIKYKWIPDGEEGGVASKRGNCRKKMGKKKGKGKKRPKDPKTTTQRKHGAGATVADGKPEVPDNPTNKSSRRKARRRGKKKNINSKRRNRNDT